MGVSSKDVASSRLCLVLGYMAISNWRIFLEGMVSTFNLVYYHKKTKERFTGRRLADGRYCLMDSNGKKMDISPYSVRQSYDADKNNKSLSVKLELIKKDARPKRIFSKKFQDWLNESDEKLSTVI